jgi:hypothetical protein
MKKLTHALAELPKVLVLGVIFLMAAQVSKPFKLKYFKQYYLLNYTSDL